jgi:hypothetical protein
MKSLIGIITFFLVYTSTFAQNTEVAFPVYKHNPVWSYVVSFFWGGGWDTYTTSYVRDTTICGYEYSFTPYNCFIRSDSFRSYFRKGYICSDPEYLAYDFTLEVGDSAWVGSIDQFSQTIHTEVVVVDSVDTLVIKGIPRKALYITCFNPWGSMIFDDCWVYGIGSMKHPFYFAQCFDNGLGGCEIDFSLLCLDSTGVRLLDYPNEEDCYTMSLGADPLLKTPAPILYPNPAADYINIKSTSEFFGTLELYDAFGKQILRSEELNLGTSEFKMDISTLPTGTYWLWNSERQFNPVPFLKK